MEGGIPAWSLPQLLLWSAWDGDIELGGFPQVRERGLDLTLVAYDDNRQAFSLENPA